MAHAPLAAGSRYGRLTLTGSYLQRPTGRRHTCICDCGSEHQVWETHLRSGRTTQCSKCQLHEIQEMRISHGHTRGRAPSPEYRSWQSMKARCENPSNNRFSSYAKRGITICQRWASFENFLADMGLKPRPRMTIERLDNNGNYEPGNCVWATYKVQQRNRSNNRVINYAGRDMPLAEAVELAQADGYAINYMAAHNRLRLGWSVVDALTRPMRRSPTRSKPRSSSSRSNCCPAPTPTNC